MNCNPDGTALTVADFRRIAQGAGLGDKADALLALHNTGLITSGLISLTAQVRFGAFCRGDLALRTTTFTPSAPPSMRPDPEILAFVTKGLVKEAGQRA